MTLRIADLPADIAATDRLALDAMTRATLADRPSFRRVAASVDGRPAEIFTRRERRLEAHRQRLVLRTGDRVVEFGAERRAELERLLADLA